MRMISRALMAAALIWAVPSVASAAAILCPGGAAPGPGSSRQYEVANATDAVCGDGNLSTGDDEFIDGGYFGGGWTGAYTDQDGSGVNGLDFVVNAGGRDGTWSIDTSILNYLSFSLGIKDGGRPSWAVFLLDMSFLNPVTGILSGTWAITSHSGDIGHGALYFKDPGGGGTGGTGGQEIPEPASLLLLAGGIGAAAFTARRRRKAVR